MADKVPAQFDADQIESFEQMQRDGRASSRSEAIRIASKRGLEELGYRAGRRQETTLKRIAAEVTRALAWIALAWLALTALFPVEYRIGALFAAFAALGSAGLYYLLDRHEPAVSRRLFGRERA